MKGQVTRTHIKNGKPNKCFSCPIALSLKEKFPGNSVSVFETQALVGGTWYYIRRGARFIKRFDAGLKVKPMTYEMTPRYPNY